MIKSCVHTIRQDASKRGRVWFITETMVVRTTLMVPSDVR